MALPIPLRLLRHLPKHWKRLERLLRAGWVRRRVRNPETVARHVRALMRLARILGVQVLGFTVRDIEDLVLMVEVHDLPESIVGDEITLCGDSARKKRLRFKREQEAMLRICAPLGTVGDRIYSLWLRFEKGNDKVAQFARALDKYQAIEQALRYARKDRRLLGLGAEFIMHSPSIEHPVIRARFVRELVAPYENL